MFSLARQSCSDVLYNDPQEVKVSDHLTSVGRIMCAKQNGKPYGTFTGQRVITQGLRNYPKGVIMHTDHGGVAIFFEAKL